MIKIRFANIDDADELANIEKECFTDPWSKESLEREIIVNKLSNILIAEIDDIIAGYMGIWFILDEGHITNVAVKEEYRNQGIATLMMNKVIELAKENNVTCFTLEVRASNKEAISLYKKFGFSEYGIRKEYYEDNNEDAIIMWREDI